jgi:hypothetical protein
MKKNSQPTFLHPSLLLLFFNSIRGREEKRREERE